MNTKKEPVQFSGIRERGKQDTSKDVQRLHRQRKVSRRPETLPNPCKDLSSKRLILKILYLSGNNNPNMVLIFSW